MENRRDSGKWTLWMHMHTPRPVGRYTDWWDTGQVRADLSVSSLVVDKFHAPGAAEGRTRVEAKSEKGCLPRPACGPVINGDSKLWSGGRGLSQRVDVLLFRLSTSRRPERYLGMGWGCRRTGTAAQHEWGSERNGRQI